MKDVQALAGALVELVAALVRAEVRAATAPSALPRYVSAKEYAEARSIAVSTVRAAIREGRLPAKHIGRAVRIPSDAEIAPATRAESQTSSVERRLGLVPGGAK